MLSVALLPVLPFQSTHSSPLQVPTSRRWVGSGLAFHPFSLSHLWGVDCSSGWKEEGGSGNLGLGRISKTIVLGADLKGRLIETNGELPQRVVTAKLTSRLGPEFGALKTAICPPWSLAATGSQAARKDFSFLICRVTQLVEMQESPLVAKYKCEILSSTNHKHHKWT